MCRIGGTLAVMFTLVMFEAYLRQGENAVTQTFEFPGTDGGWRPKLGDTFLPSDRHREKQNWRGGRHDQSRLKTMSMDGASVREASATTTTGQALARPALRRVLVAVPPSRRKLAVGYCTVSGPPLWSFGGQGRKLANVGVHTETRTVEVSHICAPLRERRTCQPKLVRARSIGPGALRALQQLPALRFASWPCLTDTSSTASSFVIDLFSAGTDLQRFFLFARLHPFSDDDTIFDENSRYCVHVGKWSDSRRDALATSIFALCCQKSSTSAKCDTTLETASFKIFRQMSGQQRQFVCRRLFASSQSTHQLKDSFFVLPTLSYRICGNPVDCKL